MLQQTSSAQEKAPRLTGLKEREAEPSLGRQLPPPRGVSLRGAAAANAFSPAPARFAGPLPLRELRNPNPSPRAGSRPCSNPSWRQRSLPASPKTSPACCWHRGLPREQVKERDVCLEGLHEPGTGQESKASCSWPCGTGRRTASHGLTPPNLEGLGIARLGS